MLGPIDNSVRFAFRAIWFALELFIYFGAYVVLLIRKGGKPTQADRSRWLQWCSRRTLRVFGVNITATGTAPRCGLLVSNHLSYLDILVLVSLTPAVFVSKAEVKHWPVFGWFARLAGTLFIDRTKRSDVSRMNELIEHALGNSNVVVLFPEGTSWNGSEILPFKSSLLEPIVGAKHPLNISHLAYTVPDGNAANDVCYWGEATFFPHLVKLMTKAHVQAMVRFAPVGQPAVDRKELALQLHAAISQLGTTGHE